MRQLHHRSAQVWHALSRDHTGLLHDLTVLQTRNVPATNAFIHEWNKPCLILISQQKLDLIYRPRSMEGRVGLSIATVSKQSTQDRYVTEILVVGCSNCHASLGNWGAGAKHRITLISWAASHDTNHWATQNRTSNTMVNLGGKKLKVKVKVRDTWYSASVWGNCITEALRYGSGTRRKGSHSVTLLVCRPTYKPEMQQIFILTKQFMGHSAGQWRKCQKLQQGDQIVAVYKSLR